MGWAPASRGCAVVLCVAALLRALWGVPLVGFCCGFSPLRRRGAVGPGEAARRTVAPFARQWHDGCRTTQARCTGRGDALLLRSNGSRICPTSTRWCWTTCATCRVRGAARSRRQQSLVNKRLRAVVCHTRCLFAGRQAPCEEYKRCLLTYVFRRNHNMNNKMHQDPGGHPLRLNSTGATDASIILHPGGRVLPGDRALAPGPHPRHRRFRQLGCRALPGDNLLCVDVLALAKLSYECIAFNLKSVKICRGISW